MSVKTQNRKTLNFTTIHKRISEQGKTISELAPEYSMTEEAFIQEMKSGLGPKVFSALKKMSEKNEKARERLKSSAEKKRKNNQKLLEKKLQTEDTDISIEREIEQLLAQKNGVENQIKSWEGTISALLISKEEKQKEISNLAEELQVIRDRIAKSKSELKSKENEYQNSINEKCKLESKLSGISEQIEVLEQSIIYLVAPGYHGKKPNFGKFISTEEIEGMNVEIQKGELLINDESLDNMMLCGYYDVREYMRALEFAKLCISHVVECDHYEILIDDERISKVLTSQEIEVKL